MLNFCIKSCQICDYTGKLTELIRLKKQLSLVGGDETLLQTPYGLTQHVNIGDEHNDAVNHVMANMTEYMEGIIFVDSTFENVKHTCKNRHNNCAYWVAIGECEAVRDLFTNLSIADVNCLDGCQIVCNRPHPVLPNFRFGFSHSVHMYKCSESSVHAENVCPSLSLLPHS